MEVRLDLTILCSRQDLEEEAPAIWRQRAAGNDDFDASALSYSEQKQLEVWNRKRLELLRVNVEQEMKGRLEEHDIVFVQSKPFHRFVVCTSDYFEENDGKTSSTADLTLWEPTEEQLELLKEGTCVRMSNVSVKDETFECRLQLVANSRTRFRSAEADIADHINKITSKRLGLVQVHALSKRKSMLVFNLAAIVMEVVVTSMGMQYIATDRSGLVVRIECFEAGTASSIDLPERFPVLVFQGLRLVDYDSYSNCAVAEMGSESTVNMNTTDPSVCSLQRWVGTEDGQTRLCKLAPYIKARLSPVPVAKNSRSLVQALGYLTDFMVLHGGELVVKVDCFATGIQSWSLPLSLLSRIKYLHKQERSMVFLSPEEEQRLSQLSSLDCIVRIKSLLRFVLQPQNDHPEGHCRYVVVDVSVANAKAVAQLYHQFCALE